MQMIRKAGIVYVIFLFIAALLIVNAAIKLHHEQQRYNGMIKCYNSNYYARIILKTEFVALRDVRVRFNGRASDASYYYKDIVLDANNFNKIMRCMDYTEDCNHGDPNDPSTVDYCYINTYSKFIHGYLTLKYITYKLKNDGHISVHLSGSAL